MVLAIHEVKIPASLAVDFHRVFKNSCGSAFF
jgi:hypothetical protein